MFTKISKIINIFSIYLIRASLRLKSDSLTCFILLINLKKMKKIKTHINRKKIIVLSKSGGIDDLNSAYSSIAYNDIAFYELPRNLIKEIFIYFIKDSEYRDYYTLDYDDKIKLRKKEYKNFLHKVFKKLDYFWKFDACISFNLFYFAENDLPEPFQRLNKKFFVLHKESVNSLEESIINLKTYSSMNKKFNGNKIAVYCENEKNILIESKILNKNQIEITGCARTDYCYQLRDITPNQNELVYFMIENNRSVTEIKSSGRLVDWSDLIIKTNSYLKELALKNKNLKIIFKGKKNVHTVKDIPKDLPDNCFFSNTNPGHKFLKNANIVMAFNSTILFEAILANRNVLIPLFDVNKNNIEKLIYKSPNIFLENKDIFFSKIDELLNKRYSNRDMSKEEKECINFYLGNIDGKSGYRLRQFITNNL